MNYSKANHTLLYNPTNQRVQREPSAVTAPKQQAQQRWDRVGEAEDQTSRSLGRKIFCYGSTGKWEI